jgi:hypothetical protein
MPRGHIGKLDAPTVVEGIGTDEERIRPLAHKCSERRIDLAVGRGTEDLKLHSHGAGSHLNFLPQNFGARGIGGIDKRGYTSGPGQQFMEKRQPFGHHLAS